MCTSWPNMCFAKHQIIVMFKANAFGLPCPHPCNPLKKSPCTTTNPNKISSVQSAFIHIGKPSSHHRSVHCTRQITALIPIFNEFLDGKRWNTNPNNSSFPYSALIVIFQWNRNSLFFPFIRRRTSSECNTQIATVSIKSGFKWNWEPNGARKMLHKGH